MLLSQNLNNMGKISIFAMFVFLLFTQLAAAETISSENKSDDALFETIAETFDYYLNLDIDSASKYLLTLYEISADTNYSHQARCSIREGMLMQYLQDYVKAEELYQKSMIFFYKANDFEGVAACLNNIGTIIQNRGDFVKAGEIFFRQLRMADSISDKQLQSKAYLNIGTLFYHQQQYADAINNYKKSIQLKKEIGDKRGQALIYNNLASIYYFMDDVEKSLTCFRESLALYIAEKDKKNQAMPLFNIGEIYFNNYNDHEKALFYYKKAYDIEFELGDISGQAASLSKIGNCYRAAGKISLALKMQLESIRLVEEYKIETTMPENYLDLANTYEATKDYQKALTYFKRHKTISDSLSKIDTAAEILTLQGEYEAEKQNKSNIEANNERTILMLQIDNQLKNDLLKKYLFFLLILSLFATLLLIFTAIKVYPQKIHSIIKFFFNKSAQNRQIP